MDDRPTSDPKNGEDPAASIYQRVPVVSLIGILATFLISLYGAVSTAHTQSLVQASAHAESLTRSFYQSRGSIQDLLAMKAGYNRSDEQFADMSLTALYNLSETVDDRRTLLTIAARLLNASACSAVGGPTARFLAVIVANLKNEDSPEDKQLLRFMRTRAYLDLAASDITTAYYQDDNLNIPDGCIGHKGRVQSPPSTDDSSRNLPLMPTPSPGDHHNYATLWGDQAMWQTSKVELFQELRPEGYRGWIHIATQELPDECTSKAGVYPHGFHEKCIPIELCFASPASWCTGNKTKRSIRITHGQYLRDAAPIQLSNSRNIPPFDKMVRLGHVIGIVDSGECVQPGAVAKIHVFWSHRRLVHEWLQVHENDACT